MADLLGKWYHEDLGHGAVHSMKFGDVLYTATTPFQKVEVVQTEAYGYALMLDGVLNSAEKVIAPRRRRRVPSRGPRPAEHRPSCVVCVRRMSISTTSRWFSPRCWHIRTQRPCS